MFSMRRSLLILFGLLLIIVMAAITPFKGYSRQSPEAVQHVRSVKTAAVALLPAAPAHVQDSEVMKGTWCWACCKEGVYSGSMELDTFDDPGGQYNFKGKFSGAGGGDVTGKIDGTHVKFTRVSGACSSGGNQQVWEGTLSGSEELGWVIKGSLSGCNDKTDENIKAYSGFVMNRKKECP